MKLAQSVAKKPPGGELACLVQQLLLLLQSFQADQTAEAVKVAVGEIASELLNSVFLSANSIFFIPFILSAIVVLLISIMRNHGMNFRAAWRTLFSAQDWLNKQTAIDAALSLWMLTVSSRLVFWIQNQIYDRFTEITGAQLHFSWNLHWPIWIEALLVTSISMLAYDFASYGAHRLLHHRILWKIHSFHHSAEKLTFFTTYRQHLLEPFVLGIARSLGVGISLLLIYSIFPNQTPGFTILGLGAGFFIYMLTVNLHHAPVAVAYPVILRSLLISPHAHHIHHSKEDRHQGKNYGVVFSVWDRWFGTYCDEF